MIYPYPMKEVIPPLPACLNSVDKAFKSFIEEIRTQEWNIESVHFSNLEVTHEDLSKLDFKGVLFDNCKFVDCDFSKSFFMNVHLVGSNFSNCLFDNVYVKKCFFNASKMTGFMGAQSLIEDTYFKDCHMKYAHFAGAKISKSTFNHCNLQESDFMQAEFKSVQVSEVDFESANFFKAVLGGMDFSTSYINGITLSKEMCELKGVTLNPLQACEIATLLGIKIKS